MRALRIPNIPDHFNCVTIEVTSLSNTARMLRFDGDGRSEHKEEVTRRKIKFKEMQICF